MSDSFDVIVVGLGAMGAAACLHLARRGARVLGVERFDIPNAVGSSHGFSRMIRLAYYEHADYVPLLRHAYTQWGRLESEAGRRLLFITGGLYAGPRGCELVEGSLRAARAHGLPFDALDGGALPSRFPQAALPGDFVGMYEHNAGFLLPELAICAMADRAMRSGAELHGREAVVAYEAGDGGVAVRTDRGAYRARTVVFCGGAWSGKLLRGLRVPLVVTRQVMGWVWPRKVDRFDLGRCPVWAIEDGKTPGFLYGFPVTNEGAGLKVAWHYPMTPVDPETVNRDAGPGDEETFRPGLRRFLPDADGPLLSLRACLYTNSPDGHFIVDKLPGEPRVMVACGFSGHGFKFAPVIGQALADLALDGGTDLPMGFLGLGRFAK